jgi:hypothetical protein
LLPVPGGIRPHRHAPLRAKFDEFFELNKILGAVLAPAGLASLNIGAGAIFSLRNRPSLFVLPSRRAAVKPAQRNRAADQTLLAKAFQKGQATAKQCALAHVREGRS